MKLTHQTVWGENKIHNISIFDASVKIHKKGHFHRIGFMSISDFFKKPLEPFGRPIYLPEGPPDMCR